MGQRRASGLLNHFKIETEFREDRHVEISRRLEPGRGRSMVQFEKEWRKVSHLGSGGFGDVSLEENQLGDKRAVNCVKKKAGKHDCYKELLAMAQLCKHPDKFVQFLGWFEDSTSLFVAMEYFQFRDLHSHILNRRSCTETVAQTITLQILDGLSFMHKMGLTHRDLKPQNIFVASPEPHWWMKIGDFGISKQVVSTVGDTAMRTEVGTALFQAPEVKGLVTSTRSYYTNSVDVWSLGCVTYWLLTQTVPFLSANDLCKYVTGHTAFPIAQLNAKAVSKNGVAFLAKALTAEPDDRLTITAALHDAWLVNDGHRYHNAPELSRDTSYGYHSRSTEDFDDDYRDLGGKETRQSNTVDDLNDHVTDDSTLITTIGGTNTKQKSAPKAPSADKILAHANQRSHNRHASYISRKLSSSIGRESTRTTITSKEERTAF